MGLGASLFSKKNRGEPAQDLTHEDVDRQPLCEGTQILGIDLGTTHTLLALNRSTDQEVHLEVQKIRQTVSPGVVKALRHLPSFLFIPGAQEAVSDVTLPWGESPDGIVGVYAREMSAKMPGRSVHSAKSWLSQASADPKQALLPLHSDEDVEKISPFEAVKAYLAHVKADWNQQHPEHVMEDQDVVITVPASFDPAARDLTAEAAQSLGLRQLTLLEEPQAATYAWIADHQDRWRDQLNVGDLVLVVDVGGGTTDLSLIRVFEQDGVLGLERVAVGEHILLGGDNMDLALAYALTRQLGESGTTLKPWQMVGMTHSCREAKETLFANPSLDSTIVVVPGRGSALVGGTIKTELTRTTLESTLVDGFFPEVDSDARPAKATRGGLTQVGLAYAQDPGITRHIAAFLAAHGDESGAVKPTTLLLNGGVFKAGVLCDRLLKTLNHWLGDAGPIRLLDECDLDHGVARGAAYYGRVRQGEGLRIRGGLASTFYIGVCSAMPAVPGMPPMVQALCVAPFGMEEGDSLAEITSQPFGLVVGESVAFQFFGSNTRTDPLGTLLDDWDEGELYPLPDIQATVPETLGGGASGDVVPVKLGTRVSELGTLEVYATPIRGGEPFKVQLDVRETKG